MLIRRFNIKNYQVGGVNENEGKYIGRDEKYRANIYELPNGERLNVLDEEEIKPFKFGDNYKRYKKHYESRYGGYENYIKNLIGENGEGSSAYLMGELFNTNRDDYDNYVLESYANKINKYHKPLKGESRADFLNRIGKMYGPEGKQAMQKHYYGIGFGDRLHNGLVAVFAPEVVRTNEGGKYTDDEVDEMNNDKVATALNGFSVLSPSHFVMGLANPNLSAGEVLAGRHTSAAPFLASAIIDSVNIPIGGLVNKLGKGVLKGGVNVGKLFTKGNFRKISKKLKRFDESINTLVDDVKFAYEPNYYHKYNNKVAYYNLNPVENILEKAKLVWDTQRYRKRYNDPSTKNFIREANREINKYFDKEFHDYNYKKYYDDDSKLDDLHHHGDVLFGLNVDYSTGKVEHGGGIGAYHPDTYREILASYPKGPFKGDLGNANAHNFGRYNPDPRTDVDSFFNITHKYWDTKNNKNELLSTAIHEADHSINRPDYLSKNFVNNVGIWGEEGINKFRNRYSDEYLEYLIRPEEVSARLTELKRMVGLKPHQVISPSILKELRSGSGRRKEGLNLLIDIFGPEKLSELSKIQYKMGGNIKRFDINDYGRIFQDGGEIEEQKKWLQDYVNSPMYRQRLSQELGKNGNYDVDSEIKERSNNLLGLDYKVTNRLPKNFLGLYNSKYPHDKEVHLDGDKILSDSYINLKDRGKVKIRKGHINDLTPLHEFSHAIDDGGSRIPDTTIRDIFDRVEGSHYVKSNNPTTNTNHRYGDVNRSFGLPNNTFDLGFDYVSTPSELMARQNVLSYLLNKEGIYDAKKEAFDKEHFEKMLNNSNIIENNQVREYLDAVKGSNPEEFRNNVMWLMNNIAFNKKPYKKEYYKTPSSLA